MLYYEFYENIENVKDYIDENLDLLQCVVCKINITKRVLILEKHKNQIYGIMLTI